MSIIEATFAFDKTTKNTVRFSEVLADDTFDTPLVGVVYIPKSTLKKLEWKEGQTLLVTVRTGA